MRAATSIIPVIVLALALGLPGALSSASVFSNDTGYTFVGEGPDGEVIVRHLTEAELKHEGGPGPIDGLCGGLAPAVLACTNGPIGSPAAIVHGFAFPDCGSDATNVDCFAGTLESRIVGSDGTVRVFRYGNIRAGAFQVSQIDRGWGSWPYDAATVTQECSAGLWRPANALLEPLPNAPPGAGQWLCWVVVYPDPSP